MNLADYLSELLGQQEEASIPGLGYFVRERISGYYNEKDARFYPPYHQVKFVAEPKEDDDTFTQYVADQKNISLASSKYFTEKFIVKLREQAAVGKYGFADLGSFQADHNQQLVFKPFDKIATDPSFYGYPTVIIPKVTNGSSTKPVTNDTQLQESDVITLPADQDVIQTTPQQEYFEEDVERRKRLNTWMIVLVILTIFVLAFFGLYKFFPDTFNKIGSVFESKPKPDTSVPVYRHEEIKADTIKKTTPANDTTVKSTSPAPAAAVTPIDTVKRTSWEVIENSFRQLGRANADVKRLKAKGIEAKIETRAPGPLLKISVGSYPTYEVAETKRLEMIKDGKIKKNSQILEIKLTP